MRTILIIVFGLLGNGLSASSEAPIPTNFDFELQKIFFTDAEEELIYIDFDAIDLAILSIEIEVDEEVVYKEDVETIAQDSIFELEVPENGHKEFIVTLKTTDGLSISKSFEALK